MIYYGRRSHPNYLDRLWELSRNPEPHRIITVAGGSAYLDAIGVGCSWIEVVDIDPENLNFQRRIYRSVIEHEELDGFIEELRSLAAPINFDGINLTRGVFNWTLGQGILASQNHYAIARSALIRCPPMFALADFCSFDFGRDEPVHFLASNVDSPLFSTPGCLLAQVSNTAKGKVWYHSWVLDIQITPTGIRY